jgi:aspartyl-tRNA(Asn)/glutamyl-tRNA(Gln) amidotransferase subunit A
MGFSSTGLPLSMQVAGKAFDEKTILRVGAAYQQRTDWHRRVPSLVGEVAVAA